VQIGRCHLLHNLSAGRHPGEMGRFLPASAALKAAITGPEKSIWL